MEGTMKKLLHSTSKSFFFYNWQPFPRSGNFSAPLSFTLLYFKRAYRTLVSSIFKVNGDKSLYSGILNYGFLFQQIQIDDGLLEGGFN